MARTVLLSVHASEDFGCAGKLSAAEQIKPVCCVRLLWSPFLLTLLPAFCPSTLHKTITKIYKNLIKFNANMLFTKTLC